VDDAPGDPEKPRWPESHPSEKQPIKHHHQESVTDWGNYLPAHGTKPPLENLWPLQEHPALKSGPVLKKSRRKVPICGQVTVHNLGTGSTLEIPDMVFDTVLTIWFWKPYQNRIVWYTLGKTVSAKPPKPYRFHRWNQHFKTVSWKGMETVSKPNRNRIGVQTGRQYAFYNMQHSFDMVSNMECISFGMDSVCPFFSQKELRVLRRQTAPSSGLTNNFTAESVLPRTLSVPHDTLLVSIVATDKTLRKKRRCTHSLAFLNLRKRF
jgi:hypothetical protein